MVFSSSPTLHRIRQLVRLICKHPDLTAKPRNTAWRPSELPDPEQFMDATATQSAVSGRTDLSGRRKRATCPRKTGR
jgi:hypothetical protein